ncbi:MAG: hypothetical protein ABID54_11050, partial [Pseudomonadota bacterium]
TCATSLISGFALPNRQSAIGNRQSPDLDLRLGRLARELPRVAQEILDHHPQQPYIAVRRKAVLNEYVNPALGLRLAQGRDGLASQTADVINLEKGFGVQLSDEEWAELMETPGIEKLLEGKNGNVDNG